MKYVQMPLRSFLSRYPYLREYLPFSEAEIEHDPYYVRFTPDMVHVEFGFLGDKWQIA